MSILMWVIVGLATILGYILFLILIGVTYYYFSKKVLERRYKAENDRSRPINAIANEVGGVTSYEQLLRNNVSAKGRSSVQKPNDNGTQQHSTGNQGLETQAPTTPTSPSYRPLPTFTTYQPPTTSPSGLDFLDENEG